MLTINALRVDMKILFISRVKFGTMGSGALNWFPGYVQENGHDVKIVECLSAKSNEIIVDNPKFNLDVHEINSNLLYEHLDAIFNIAESFEPDIFYVFGRADIFDFVYHLRHRFIKTKIVIDIRSPLLIQDGVKKKLIENKFYKVQHYVDHINTCDLDSLRTYSNNIFKPVSVLPIGVNISDFKVINKVNYERLKKFVFIGSLYRKRHVDILIKNFYSFSESVKFDATLDIYGAGDAVKELKDLIFNMSAHNIIKLNEALPQESLFQKLADYDVGIAYVPYELFSVAPSLKSIEYAAAGIPILASDTQGHQKYSRDHNFRFKLFSNDSPGFIKAFTEVYLNGFSSNDISANHQAVQPFDWKNIVKYCLLPSLENHNNF